jgi:glycosyltransferase involved in cell wall biosynthesis
MKSFIQSLLKNIKERFDSYNHVMPNLKPRVFHLISSCDFLGAENVTLELAKASAREGYWVTIGILENRRNLHMKLAERVAAERIDMQVFPCRRRFDFKTISTMRAFIETERPNLLHSHGYKANFYILCAKGLRLPWVVTNHLWKKTTFALKLYACLDSIIVRFADRIVAVSGDIASEMIRRGISHRRIVAIDNGVDIQRFTALKNNDVLRNSLGLNGKAKIIGTVASLTEEKGHLYLIQAAETVISLLPDARFLIVGDGRERLRLEKRVTELGLTGKIIFIGSRNDIPDILSILDVFMLPSLKEGLPMALLEAQAAQVPVIATSVGAVPKVIENGITGILIQPKDPQAIANAITQTFSNRGNAIEMAQKGFEKVRDNFSSKQMFEKYLTVYKDLLA